MQKNKALNVFLRLLKIIGRVLILNIPAVIILLGLMFFHQLSWITAGISLLAFWSISGIIVFYVFKDLDNFILYMKNLAQGFEPEFPKFHWGMFSSLRLSKSFLAVKNLWSNQFLSDTAILHGLPNPLIMLDNKFKIVFANASACQFFGKSVLGKNLKTVFKNSSLLALAEHLNEESTISKTIPEWDLVGEKKQKLTFQIKMDKLPAPTKDGAIMAISFFDITPFKLFKEQQADFFANASHELKTPLAVISGCVETLQGEAKNDSAATQKFLNLIAEQNARMTDLVQKMLKLARFQSNISSRNQTSIAINELIQKVISDFYPRIQSLNKKIIFNKGRNIPLFQASTDELYHVFQNLIDNALKYGADKSVVRVSSHFDEKQKTLIISVHNFGPPIPKENLNRVFDKFFRVESGKSLTAEGNGLGLGIVQQIVQRYHGKVEVQSSPKDGTTFFVYLPTEE